MMITDSEKTWILQQARHTIAETIGVESLAPAIIDDKTLRMTCGVFVTIIRSGRLRGCIGMIESEKPLYRTVAEMAAAAARHDPRFPGIDAREFSDVSIEVSVLSPLRRIAGLDDIVIGQHGLVVQKEMTRGLLLPQVASEHGWNALTFVEETCAKAGLPPDAWKDERVELYVFTAEVFGEEDNT